MVSVELYTPDSCPLFGPSLDQNLYHEKKDRGMPMMEYMDTLWKRNPDIDKFLEEPTSVSGGKWISEPVQTFKN